MKDILILGSTGSIGTQAVDVIEAHPDAFRLAGVAAYSHWQAVARQVQDHQVKWACMVDEKAADELRRAVGPACTVFSGSEGLLKLIDECDARIVLSPSSVPPVSNRHCMPSKRAWTLPWPIKRPSSLPASWS